MGLTARISLAIFLTYLFLEALREIKDHQATGDLLLRKGPFSRLVRETVQVLQYSGSVLPNIEYRYVLVFVYV